MITFIVAVGVGYYGIAVYNKKKLYQQEFSWLRLIDELFLTVLVFLGIGRNVYYFAQPMSVHLVIIALYYGLSAMVLLWAGLIFKRQYIRYLGIGCGILTVWTLWIIVNQIVNPLYRIILFISIGSMFVLLVSVVCLLRFHLCISL